MTVDILLMLLLLGIMMLVLAIEWIPIDVAALAGLIILVVSGLLSPQEAFTGFANEVIFVLASLFILSATLAKSGITNLFAEAILKRIKGPRSLTISLMSIVASISAFVSNTNTIAMIIPVAMEVSKKARVSASRLLMPLAFASILGGTCTLIGTSTNLASAGLLMRLGLDPFSLFEFIIPGVLVSLIGILYMSFIGYKLLPQHQSEEHAHQEKTSRYLAELLIEESSAAIGQALSELQLNKNPLLVLALIRNNKTLIAHDSSIIQAGDKVLVKGSREALLKCVDSKKFSIDTEQTFADKEVTINNLDISEFILMPRSRLIGKTLKQLDFNRRNQVSVLAIYRRHHFDPGQLQETRLQSGDVLLMQGEKEQLKQLATNYSDLWVSEEAIKIPLSVRKGVYVLSVMLAAVLLISLSILPASIAFLIAVLVLVFTGLVNMEEAYSSIEWRILVLIACMSSFGLAMETTGSAAYLAKLIIDFIYPIGLTATLASFALLTIILTQPMSNAAAALVILPVALETAGLIGVDARPFAVMVTLSASLSFITPLEPANLLIFGVGHYRFMDFVKVGLPLTLIIVLILVLIVPLLWPF